MPTPAVDFDPYREWLSITEIERPLSPYQLLALTPLESDPNRIRAGYLRQQSSLLLHASNTDPQVWNPVNRELDEAYAVLCDADQKALLDAAIRRKATAANGKPPGANGAAAALASVTCRHCQRPSPANRRFCGGCGQSLWESCPQCHADCPANERYCGSCGTDIQGDIDEQSRQLQAGLDEARRLTAAHDYEAAIVCLQRVAAASDSRFGQWADEALVEINRVQLVQRNEQAAAESALARGRQLLEARCYDRAIAELESIPAPLCGSEASMLLARARATRDELTQLAAEIRSALEHKRTAELAPLINRLLVLSPDHQQGRQIAEQLRNNLVSQAKKRLAAHQYRAALEQLERISPLVRSEEVETLIDTADELAALLDGVRGAALADRTTLTLADRLIKLAPGNEEAARLRAQLAQQAQARPGDPRFGTANAAPPPKRTPFGPPVDLLANSARIPAADATVQAKLAEHPGQFFVALGLALQGLGLAAVSLDLMPKEPTSVLQMQVLPGRLTLGRRGVETAWGLDLSDHSLKAVKVVKDKDAGPKVIACHFSAHDGPEQAHRSLQELAANSDDLKGAKVGVNLPGQRVLGRIFELPPPAGKNLEGAIAFEARHQLPIALDELCWASHVLDRPSGKDANDKSWRIVVAAAREVHLKQRISLVRAAGIEVDLVQSDCLALHNVVVFEWLSGAAPHKAICTLDLGMDHTNIVISSPRNVWFRTVGMGSRDFANLLVKEFNLTHQQAAQLIREPHRARRYGQWCAALRPAMAQLAGELTRSLTSYDKQYPSDPVEQILGVGGGLQMHGLLRHLRFGK
jgi:type IV pilus assembly protein PilM